MALAIDDRLREVTSFDESKTGVKGLSDAGITSIPRFFVHPPETLSSLKSSISLSILLPNHVPGLQVKHNDDWVDVNPVLDVLIINAGDLLQIMSNDEYKSVQHRVLANSLSEPRISAAMFFDVVGKYKETDEFGPLPELVSPENHAKYRNFTIVEFKEAFFDKEVNNKTGPNFQNKKKLIDV